MVLPVPTVMRVSASKSTSSVVLDTATPPPVAPAAVPRATPSSTLVKAMSPTPDRRVTRSPMRPVALPSFKARLVIDPAETKEMVVALVSVRTSLISEDRAVMPPVVVAMVAPVPDVPSALPKRTLALPTSCATDVIWLIDTRSEAPMACAAPVAVCRPTAARFSEPAVTCVRSPMAAVVSFATDVVSVAAP